MAPVTTGNEGTDRILIKAATYTAKYRDGQGRVVERPTGCRDETAARSILAELEKRAELVKAKVISTAQDSVADHQNSPLSDHFDDYLTHLKAKHVSDSYRYDQERCLQRIAKDCGFSRLLDLDRSALECWLLRQSEAGMSARTSNAYRAAAVGFCNWCVDTHRLISNPFATIVTLNVKPTRAGSDDLSLRRNF